MTETYIMMKDFRSKHRVEGEKYIKQTIRRCCCISLQNCDQCKGICLYSDFYTAKNMKPEFIEMFNPKYHRRTIHSFQKSGLIPQPGEVCRSTNDFIAEAAAQKEREERACELEHDAKSPAMLSRKQKAKKRKSQREKEDAEVWEEVAYSAEDFLDALRLYICQEADSICDLEKRKNLICNMDSRPFNSTSKLARGNQCIGTTCSDHFKEYKSKKELSFKKHTLAEDMQIEIKDRAFAANSKVDSETLIKGLVGI